MDGGFPVLRLTALKVDGVDLSERKAGAWAEEEATPFLVSEGDFLLSRGSGSRHLVGRGAVVGSVDSPVAFPDTMIRVRVRHDLILSKYLELVWQSAAVRAQIEGSVRTTAGIYKINQKILEGVKIPIPPLAEQARIVEALEGHISRLDVAVRELGNSHRKVTSFRKSVLLSLVPEDCLESWEMTTVGEAGAIDLGRQRHPDWHHGPEMHPYLRVANVFEDRIDANDVMEMDFSGVFERFKLESGDVLLNEGQSPHLVGRPALYRGQPANVAFTNSLLRFRARSDVLPEWALMVFRRHLHARRFMREVRITTNIAHLSAKRLKAVEFPIPPLREQKRLVQRCEELLTDADSLERGLKQGLDRAQSLRKALLNRAFSGALVSQEPGDGDAGTTLHRIQVERASSKRAPRAKRPRGPRGSSAAAESDQTSGTSAGAVSVPRTTVQQEFEL
ncbi:restriction endonuclease subunit S [Streptomyces bauhiniae]